MEAETRAEIRDKVLSVFASLRRRKKDPIMAYSKLADCHDCALHKLRKEFDGNPRFAYWTAQDEETLRCGNTLRIRYGQFNGEPDDAKAVGVMVATALEAAGLKLSWSKNSSAVINVIDLKKE